MSRRYVWRGGQFVCRKTGEPMHKPFAGEITMPAMRGDLPEYISPVTGKPVDGRSARREDLKRSGCREVDPSEWRPKYHNEKFARKHGKMDQYEGPAEWHTNPHPRSS